MAAVPLIGCWHLQRPQDASESFEETEADFRPDGRLLYSINTGRSWQIMRLIYRVEANVLITDQPSHPREERTRFMFEREGTLILDHGGTRAAFTRGAKRAPDL